jgi:hypothetical protein
MPKRHTADDQATALAVLDLNKQNINRTARDLSLPVSTVHKWKHNKGLRPGVKTKCIEKKEALSTLFERIARKYLDRAEEDDAIASTRGKDAIIAAATATDKMLLLRGQPTAITQSLNKSADIDAATKRLVEAARAEGQELTEEEARALIEEIAEGDRVN